MRSPGMGEVRELNAVSIIIDMFLETNRLNFIY
jgi:hypothetical protein